MADRIGASSVSAPRQAGNFLWHFLEMCIPMCIGVGLVAVALRGFAAAGLADPRLSWPAPSFAAVAVALTLPMIGWMRFRRMAWGPIVEMTASGIGLAVVAAAAGIIPASPVAPGDVCGVECVGMVAAMLFRLDLYTGRSGHHHSLPVLAPR